MAPSSFLSLLTLGVSILGAGLAAADPATMDGECEYLYSGPYSYYAVCHDADGPCRYYYDRVYLDERETKCVAK